LGNHQVNGKGDTYRRVNTKTYADNYDTIFKGSKAVGVIKIPVRCAEVEVCDNHCWRAQPHYPSDIDTKVNSIKCPFRGEYVKLEHLGV
jgi:hypothetical protein